VAVSYLWIADQVVNLFISQLVKSDSPTPTWRVSHGEEGKEGGEGEKGQEDPREEVS
jgi:hypothetical protein